MKNSDLRAFAAIAGHVTTIMNQVTGVGFVSIYDRQKGFDIDADFRWITVCERHGTMIGSKTLQLARCSMWSVDFCEECQQSQCLSIHDHPELLEEQ